MINAFKPNTDALPIRMAAVDGPTLELLLRPEGVVCVGFDYNRAVVLAVEIDESRLNEMVAAHGEDDGKRLLRTELLVELDSRLSAVLGLPASPAPAPAT